MNSLKIKNTNLKVEIEKLKNLLKTGNNMSRDNINNQKFDSIFENSLEKEQFEKRKNDGKVVIQNKEPHETKRLINNK